MKKYVLALDEGTTSARAILFDKMGNAVSVAQQEFAQIYPKPAFVEHNPLEIYSAQYSAPILGKGYGKTYIQRYCMAVQTNCRHMRKA